MSSYTGSNDTVLALISADAPDAMLRSLMTLRPHDLERLKVAVVRAFRALCVATANCIGPALWGLGEDNSEYKKGVQIVMESIFLVSTPLAVAREVGLISKPSARFTRFIFAVPRRTIINLQAIYY